MMKKIMLCVLLWGCFTACFGQLVRKKDYDAAFALQVGGETNMLTAFKEAKMYVRPAFGLKMTFPFNRKWFLGSEINYSELKYGFSDLEVVQFPDAKVVFNLKQIQWPIYLKYMLNCNRASVLLGVYGSYVMESDVRFSDCTIVGKQNLSEDLFDWNAGLTIGYEYQIVKHLNLMCRISAGLKEVVKDRQTFKNKLFPLQMVLTLSYDIFRIGDCGCD